MPFVEIAILVLIFVFSLWLIRLNFDASLTLLLILSVLLHKEFFSIYRWDLLPVRVFMLAFVVNAGGQVLSWVKVGPKKEEIIKFFSEPFVALLSLYWLVNGLSIFFTKNLTASLLYFAFQSTVIVLGIVLYFRLKDNPKKVKNLIWIYICIVFGLTIFGFIQLAVYKTTGFIFGALWNVHGRLPRIGATFWDVNHFAALLASLLPVLGMLVLLAKGRKQRIGYIGLFLPMGLLLLMTNSRSAWILAGVAFLTFLLIMLIRKWGVKGIYGLILTLVVITGLGFFEYSDRASPFRKVIKDYLHYRIDSFDSHMLLLRGSFQVFETYPYLGGGTGGFYEQFSKTEIAPTFFGRDPIFLTAGFRAPGHSIWGETVAETGSLGIFIFVLLMSFMLSHLLYVALTSRSKEKYLLTAGMSSALLGWLVAAVFYSYKSEFFWIIFFLYFLYGVGVMGKGYDLQKVYAYFMKSKRIPYLVLATIAAVLIFGGLGKTHFIPWDEAIYAKVAKNMVRSGDYMVLRWDPGAVWFEKPPLYIWLAALSMKLFGITEFAARLPSALLGFFTIFVVYQLAKKMFNKTTAFISALALATTTQFIYYSRAAMMDVSVTFFMTLALYCYYKTLVDRKKASNWIVIGVAVGLAAMIKNVIGFLPLVIIGINELLLIATKERKCNRDLLGNYLRVGLSAAVVFLPWHLEMLRRFGGGFVNNYLIYHVVTRGTSAIEQKGRPFWWYLIILKVSMRIWFVALLAAFPFGALQAFVRKSRRYIFMMIWILVVFLFFSSAKSKLVWYIMPVYPVLAILVGRFIERVYAWAVTKLSWLGKPAAKTLFLYCLAGFSLLYLFVVKDLVYTGDLTGAQATLLQKKDELYDLELPVHVDKVELPLIMYYTEGEYVDTDYRQLKTSLDNPLYDETIIFLTKESRFGNYAEEIEYLELVEEMGDYALGVLESQHARDLTALDKVEKEIRELGRIIAKNLNRGLSISQVDQQKLAALRAEEAYWLWTIEVGLASTQYVTGGQ